MDRQEKAFEFAKETVTQLIALSTGIVALTVTFASDFLADSASAPRNLVIGAWCAFLASVAFGIWALLALTGSLASKTPETDSIYGSNVRIPVMLQIAAFLGGMVLTVWFGVAAYAA